MRKSVRHFFSKYFSNFLEKHQSWELMYEAPEVTPFALNQSKKELTQIYKTEIAHDDADLFGSIPVHQDLNKLVEMISRGKSEFRRITLLN